MFLCVGWPTSGRCWLDPCLWLLPAWLSTLNLVTGNGPTVSSSYWPLQLLIAGTCTHYLGALVMVNISNSTTKNMTFCIIIQSTQHEKHDIKHRMNLIWRCETENKFVKILELWGDQIKTKTIRRSIQTKRLWCKNFFYV